MISKKYQIKTPTTIIETQLRVPQDYKQQCIKEAYRLGDSMNQETNVKAIMSTYRIWEQTKVFNKLISNIFEVIKILSFPTFYPKKYLNHLVLADTWSAIYKEGHYTKPHSHKPNAISFVYYLKSNSKTPIIFKDSGLKLYPKDDTLLIFESYTPHSVPNHTSKQDRICLAGNTTLYKCLK